MSRSPPKKTRRPQVACDALVGERDCGAVVYKKGLCARHYRMDQAPPCGLDHCKLPCYARVDLTPDELRDRSPDELKKVDQEGKFAVCENHYRRKQRHSAKWDQALSRTGGDLVVVTTRVRPEAKNKIEKDLPEGKALYSKLAEIIEDYAEGRLVAAA